MTGIELPITFVAIDAYARRYGVTGHFFDRLLRFVSEIDAAYLAIQREAMKFDAEKEGEKRSSGVKPS